MDLNKRDWLSRSIGPVAFPVNYAAERQSETVAREPWPLKAEEINPFK